MTTFNRLADLFTMGIVGMFAVALVALCALWVYAKVIEPIIESKRVRREWMAVIKVLSAFIPCAIVVFALICFLGLGVEYIFHASGLVTPTEQFHAP